MSSQNVAQLLSILEAPWWKVWVTGAKRREAADQLTAQGAAVADDLLQHYLQADRRDKVAEVLTRIGEPVLPALCRVADASRDKAELERVAALIEKMGCTAAPAAVVLCVGAAKRCDHVETHRVAGIIEGIGAPAAAAIPILLRWAGSTEDPRLAAMRHLTGDDELDERIVLAAGISPVSTLEKAVAKIIRQEAAAALAKMGSALAPWLSQLQALESRSDLDDPYHVFRDRIREAVVVAAGRKR